MTKYELIAERERVYKALSKTTSEKLTKDYTKYLKKLDKKIKEIYRCSTSVTLQR